MSDSAVGGKKRSNGHTHHIGTGDTPTSLYRGHTHHIGTEDTPTSLHWDTPTSLHWGHTHLIALRPHPPHCTEATPTSVCRRRANTRRSDCMTLEVVTLCILLSTARNSSSKSWLRALPACVRGISGHSYNTDQQVTHLLNEDDYQFPHIGG
jgi:hypothetical protein